MDKKDQAVPEQFNEPQNDSSSVDELTEQAKDSSVESTETPMSFDAEPSTVSPEQPVSQENSFDAPRIEMTETSDPVVSSSVEAPASDTAPTSEDVAPVAAFGAASASPFATDAAMQAQGSSDFTAPKKSKKPLLGAVLAAAIVLLGGGGVLAYNMWYQNPDKVITDSIINGVKAKSGTVVGNVLIETKDVSVSVDLDTKGSQENSGGAATVNVKMKSGEFADKTFNIKADGVFAKSGDIYFRVSNLNETFNSLINIVIDRQVESYKQAGFALTDAQIEQARTQAKSQFAPIVAKLDNQWIKVSAEDMKSESSNDSTKCVTDALQKLQDDKKLSGEIGDAYKKNKFIVVKEKLGSKDGSLGYVLDINKDAAKKFGDEAKNTEFGKMISKCDTSNSSSSSNSDDTTFKESRFELWVDRWSHKVTRITFDGKGKDEANQADLKVDLKTDFGKEVKVDIPADAKSFKDLQTELQSVSGVAGSLPL